MILYQIKLPQKNCETLAGDGDGPRSDTRESEGGRWRMEPVHSVTYEITKYVGMKCGLWIVDSGDKKVGMKCEL